MDYVINFAHDGKYFDYDVKVPENVPAEERLQHLDERAQKLSEAYGWTYVGAGPKLTEEDFDFDQSLRR